MTGDDPEDLRRRLYRRDASSADVDAYRAVAPVADRADVAARPRRRHRLALVLPAAALALAGAAAVLAQPAAPTPTPSASAARAVPPVAAVLDVQRAAVVASTTEAEREGFVRALERSRPAGLIGWSERRGGVGAFGVEYLGRGEEPLTFDLPTGPGRIEVLVVAARTASVSWTLLAPGGVPVDRRSLYVTPGDVATGALRYPAYRVPDRLLITAPSGVRWGVAVLARR